VIRASIVLGAALAGALVGAGCSGSGGHGGSAGLALAASVTSAASANTSAGPDLTPPVITVSAPARGAILPPGPVQVTGNVTDVGTGVALVTVNGSTVSLDANGNFTTTVTLDPGVAPIVVSATDGAGNRTDRSLSVETGTYLPLTQPVSDAFAGRLNATGFPALEKLGVAEITSLQATLPSSLASLNPIVSFLSIGVSIDSVSFGTPSLVIVSAPQGIAFSITVPQLVVNVTAQDASGGLIPSFTASGGLGADALTVQALAQVAVGPGGALAVTFPTANVALQNATLTLPSSLSWAVPILEPLLTGFLQSQVASMIQTQAAAKLQAILAQQATFNLLGTPATFSYAMQSIGTDASGLAFDVNADIALTPDPTYPVSPGSLVVGGGLPTTFSTQATAVFSISQDTLNRALHAAWQAGLLSTVVNPSQFAQAFGTALPFGQTGQDMVAFFPNLAGVIPPQYLAAPIIFTIRSLLPPTASFVQGVPDPLKLRFGEYTVTCSIDTGGQPLDIYTVSVQAEIELGVAIQNGGLVPVMTTLPNPLVAVDLIDEPLAPLGKAFLESYLDAMIPTLFGGIATNLPPIPIPALPGGVQLTSLAIHADGASGTYLTFEVGLQ
jgi:hypothetical protein